MYHPRQAAARASSQRGGPWLEWFAVVMEAEAVFVGICCRPLGTKAL